MITGEDLDRPAPPPAFSPPDAAVPRTGPPPDATTGRGPVATRAAGDAAVGTRTLEAVLRRYGTGAATAATPVAEGLLNRGYRVTTDAGTYFLKCYVDRATAGRAAITAQHRVTTRLHALGLPTAPPLPAVDGRTVTAVGGHRFALFPWVEGSHRAGHELSPGQCADLGTLLGLVHTALAALHPPVAQRPAPPVAAPERTEALIEDLLSRARRHRPHDGFDELAERRLRERLGLLAAHAHRRPDPAGAPLTGWVHGDFHPLNLLYRGADPVAILDWDRLGRKPCAEEAVRAATLFFHHPRNGVLDLGRVRCFSRAYRAASRTDPAQMAAAVHRVWWERLNDFWMLEWHYRRGDHRADPLFPAAAAQIVWWCEEYEQVQDACTN